MVKKQETQAEWAERKAREKRLKEVLDQFPNQANGAVLQGGKPNQFPAVEAMRATPGAPIKLPNGQRTPKSANPDSVVQDNSTPTTQPRPEADRGEHQPPSAASFYDLPKE